MTIALISARGTRIASALVFLAVGAGGIRESLRLQGLSGGDAVGSGAFPGLASLALTLAALGLLSGIGDRADPLRIEAPLRILSALLALIAFVIAMGQMPIIVAIGIFSVLFPLVLGERRPWMIFGGGVALTGAVWLMFGVVLNVPF